ncbi:MAG: hypothetical protein NZ889_02790 [Candidatus Pacearchaeota archaeon]|nr:hypothetical protein [Candidatus Pacearchaeota archaeon]
MLDKKEKEKILELIKETIRKIAGKNSEAFVSFLYEKKNINEFKIAEKLKISVNQVRNFFYKLLEYNIISFTRKKDRRKGWYTYYWTLETDKTLEVLKKMKEQEIKALKQLAKSREIKTYYVCPNKCMEVTTETALLHEFFCPECGTLMMVSDEEKKIKEIETKIKILEKDIETINCFLEKLHQKKEEKKKRRKK